jgi:hypothetical protein
MCAGMASRPEHATVMYRGIPYMLDLAHCRRALGEREILGELDSMESLARAVGISRSTACRFSAGRSTSLAVTLRILPSLHLIFEDVAWPAEDPDDQDGPAGAGVLASRSPRPPQPGLGSLGAYAARQDGEGRTTEED